MENRKALFLHLRCRYDVTIFASADLKFAFVMARTGQSSASCMRFSLSYVVLSIFVHIFMNVKTYMMIVTGLKMTASGPALGLT